MQRVLAFMALGVAIIIAVIVLGVAAHGEAQNGQVVAATVGSP